MKYECDVSRVVACGAETNPFTSRRLSRMRHDGAFPTASVEPSVVPSNHISITHRSCSRLCCTSDISADLVRARPALRRPRQVCCARRRAPKCSGMLPPWHQTLEIASRAPTGWTWTCASKGHRRSCDILNKRRCLVPSVYTVPGALRGSRACVAGLAAPGVSVNAVMVITMRSAPRL